jgi:hypothetical protein
MRWGSSFDLTHDTLERNCDPVSAHTTGSRAARSTQPMAMMSKPLHAKAALAFVREHGIVLASAKGDAPRLIEAILGEPISGNWWAHPRAGFIYDVLAEVSDSEDVLVCRLLRDKITLVHRRLWPALVRIASRFEPAQLARVREEHSPSGRHVNREVAFPLWVPPAAHEQAAGLSEQEALALLGPALTAAQPAPDRLVKRKPM